MELLPHIYLTFVSFINVFTQVREVSYQQRPCKNITH